MLIDTNIVLWAMTAHKSKGQEAHTVIVLDATAGRFPMIHSDNALFELFGVTGKSVLDEERRLFYVAISRAENCLYVLTESDRESPFLSALRSSRSSPTGVELVTQSTPAEAKLGKVAKMIWDRIPVTHASN